MSIRNLISSDIWAKLNSKDPRVIAELKKMHYLVVCDNCGKIFFDETLNVVKQEIAEGKWDQPRMWYVTAAKHWLIQSHKINFYIMYPSGTKAKGTVQGTNRGISEDWKYQLENPQNPNFQATPQQMLEELNCLERQIKGK